MIFHDLSTFWKPLGIKSALLGQKQCFLGKKCINCIFYWIEFANMHLHAKTTHLSSCPWLPFPFDSTFIREIEKERTSSYITRNKLTAYLKRGSTFIRDREKERTSSLCILSKSMLINFGIESLFVKVLRRYDTNYSIQHIGLFEGHINTKKQNR